MPFISVTRLRVKSLFFLFSFIRANEASVKELKSSSGLLMGKELIDKKLTFWTITLWEDEDSMKKFRGSLSHRKAMQHLPKLCNEASYHHWFQEENECPNWTTISDKLYSEGKLSKVRNPSNAQITNQFPPIQWTKFERKLK
jgi:heme-degrading monooxygenase HmoA